VCPCLTYSVRPKTWPHVESNIFLNQRKFMKPIKCHSVVSAYILERWCGPHILSELLKGPVKGPDQASCCPSFWWPGSTFSSQIENCTHKEAFLRKVYCCKNVRHRLVHVFSHQYLDWLLNKSNFVKRYFFTEILSLCPRDGHMKSLILTKVFHIG
jgi:hypothetical protein